MIELGEVGEDGELVGPGRDQVLHLQQRGDAKTLLGQPERQAQVPRNLRGKHIYIDVDHTDNVITSVS